jgi:hypothetical protein
MSLECSYELAWISTITMCCRDGKNHHVSSGLLALATPCDLDRYAATHPTTGAGGIDWAIAHE